MRRPAPVLTAMAAPFWEAAASGVLVAPKCLVCGRRHWEPEAACPHCGGEWAWAPSPGEGTLYSYSVVHRPAAPDMEVPYVLALVDLDDGWTMKSNLVDVGQTAVAIGMRVKVRFVETEDHLVLPLFSPAPPAGGGGH